MSKKEKKQKVKIGSRKVDNGGSSKKLTPFEDELNLASFLQVNLNGRNVGAYVLRKGENSFKIIYGWECVGIHSSLTDEQIDPIFDAIENGLKDFPSNEELTVNLGSFTSDYIRQKQLAELGNRAFSDELRYLIYSERARVQELTIAGLRKPKYLRLYASFTHDTSSAEASDNIEKILNSLEMSWKKFTGEYRDIQATLVESLFRASFVQGFESWEQLITNKVGLNVRSLTASELWQHLWVRFNESDPRAIPQVLNLSDNGLTEEINTSFLPSTYLMESENSIPHADRKWIALNNNYVGVLTFLEKPGGWVDKNSQLRYLWEVIGRDKITDTEIVCQISRANETLVKTNMQRSTKQANTASAFSSKKGDIDVKSLLNIEKGVDAQRSLYEGAVPFYCACTFLVYRKSVKELDDASRYLQSLFFRPAWVVRETEYPWRTWIQALLLKWERLLASPFNRRDVYLNSEVIGLLPLVRTRGGDSSGFELIADEGGTPIHVDLYKKHRNIGLFGTTRSGKSVIASGILTQALAHNIPVVAIDFPKPDGTGTFNEYTRFFGDRGAYFDIGSESNNLFELPNLSELDGQLQEDRFEDYKDFLCEALIGMILGSKSSGGTNRKLADTVRSVLTLALKAFFADDFIRDRYAAAFLGGLGSQEWKNTPTLVDFITFCSLERLQVPSHSTEIKEALETVKLRLRFWLSSRVGKAISAPSTFKIDAELLVFALRNLSNEDDAAILALSAYSAALRRALSSPRSIFFIDEASILFEYDSIANLIARLCANGAKSGTCIIISAQDPDTIYKSSASAKILQNLSTKLIGRIQPTAIDSFVNILKYPREIITKNSTESFLPKKESIYSQWLLDDNGIYTYCRYYPGYGLLAAVANNPDEHSERTKILAKYSSKDRLLGMNEFAQSLVIKLRS
jgi:hypothetical protein